MRPDPRQLPLEDLMRTFVITSPDTLLSVDRTHFTLRSKGRKVARIPPIMLAHVVVGAGVEVTRKALTRMVDTGVGVTFLDATGRNRSRLLPPWKNTPEVRLGQYRCHKDPARRLAMCRALVGSKVEAQLALLQRAQSNHANEPLAEAIAALKTTPARLAAAGSVAEAMGIEGWATKTYWSAFGSMIRAPWAEWTGRNRKPPKDPVNAALSYGYAILLNRVLCLLEAAGLDPYIGVLHETTGRHPAFGLDVMEPFRAALVDRTVLRLINLHQLREEHFGKAAFDPAVLLQREGRLLLLEALDHESRKAGDSFYANGTPVDTALNQTIANLRACARADCLETAEIHTPLGRAPSL